MLFMGYLFFGILLDSQNALWGLWLFVWVGSIAWILHESFTWFIPVSAGMAVFMAILFSTSYFDSGLLLSFILIIIFSLFFSFRFVGFSFRNSMNGSLWLGGLVTSLFVLYLWAFTGELKTWDLALQFVFGIMGTAFGSISWVQMDAFGYSKRQNLMIFGSLTAIALFLGGRIGQLLH